MGRAAGAAQATSRTGESARKSVPGPEVSANEAVRFPAVGSPRSTDDGATGTETVAAAVGANPRAMATVSGDHPASGDLTQTQEPAQGLPMMLS